MGKRQTASTITKGTKLYAYTYNANGIRTQKVEKTSGMVTNTTKYYYNDQNLLTAAEIPSQYGNNTLLFYYDDKGSPVSVALKRTKADGVSTENLRYYYVKNLQGDIVGMADENGVLCVNYTYDAWGNLTSVKNNSGTTITDKSTIGLLNSLRYRGYVYDTDTGLYYLQSRYYDPVTGRFLNADDSESLGASGTVLSYNLFAYCENNAINNTDPTGYFSIPRGLVSFAIDALIWSVCSGLSSIIATIT